MVTNSNTSTMHDEQLKTRHSGATDELEGPKKPSVCFLSCWMNSGVRHVVCLLHFSLNNLLLTTVMNSPQYTTLSRCVCIPLKTVDVYSTRTTESIEGPLPASSGWSYTQMFLSFAN
ncbi:hypothetical protein XENORESO_003011 [Xenotaenia resolanae]|uniref:Uncharacterized protein n=1 Tax=Xenotaenia resolanae TaxID=208358 RepID=A0ABV0VRB6_9TELE